MTVSVTRIPSVLDVTSAPFNAVGDGSTDDTTAFTDALATGRAIYTPPNRVFAVNLVVTTDNTHIGGASLYGEDATPASRLVPYNTANPIIQVGNDSNIVSGVHLSNLALIGGASGLVLGGGSYGNFFTDVFAAFQTGYCVKVGSTSAFTNPIQYNFFTNLSVRPAGSGTPVALGLYYPTSGAGATAANYFANLRVSGTTNAKAMEIDGVELFVTNAWIQVGATNKGIFFLKSGSTNPIMNCANVAVDSDSSTDNLVETYNTTKTIGSIMRGTFQVNGKLKMSDASTVVLDAGFATADYAQLINAVTKGVHYFCDASQFDTSTLTSTGRIYASSGSLYIDHQSGNINIGRSGARVNTTWPAFSGPWEIARQSVSADTTLSDTSGTFTVVDSSGGTKTITLGTAASRTGRMNTVKRSGGNAVTVQGTGGQTIDGAASKSLDSDGATISVVSNGTNWDIMSTYGTVT